jgi:hypothetical protein
MPGDRFSGSAGRKAECFYYYFEQTVNIKKVELPLGRKAA